MLFALALSCSACSGSDDKGSGGPASAGAGCPEDGSGYQSEWQAFECEVLRLVNEHRAAGATCGGEAFGAAPALAMSAQLRTAARNHAEDMAQHNYFDHDSQDGRGPSERISATGYNWSTWGENIAAGSGSAEGAVNQWMNSEGHCKNIMNASFKEIGIGYSSAPGSTYRHYWVQVFGTPR